jgi:hypothetical protein
MIDQECLETWGLKFQSELPVYEPIKLGDRITMRVNKTGWRKLWAKLTGKPISELKEFVCTVTSDETKDAYRAYRIPIMSIFNIKS